ncbi:hypothetical protein PENTCL1PPCAC_24565 [Pristionchus entomophagus]|uniref:Ribosomal protein n=1 Tax=Pristionchus entomophagus TaxID=358040 RepID=A0AAV5U7D3_9BILA|nr:hypothetical protein PENTCL1PPCAC_24565 [Pristionchus entomophagus]
MIVKRILQESMVGLVGADGGARGWEILDLGTAPGLLVPAGAPPLVAEPCQCPASTWSASSPPLLVPRRRRVARRQRPGSTAARGGVA